MLILGRRTAAASENSSAWKCVSASSTWMTAGEGASVSSGARGRRPRGSNEGGRTVAEPLAEAAPARGDELVHRLQVRLVLLEQAADRDLVQELADLAEVLPLNRRDDALDDVVRLGSTVGGFRRQVGARARCAREEKEHAQDGGLQEAVVDDVAGDAQDVLLGLLREPSAQGPEDLARNVAHAERHRRGRVEDGGEEGRRRLAQREEVCERDKASRVRSCSTER